MAEITDTTSVREEILHGRVENALALLPSDDTDGNGVMTYLTSGEASTNERDRRTTRRRGGRHKCIMDRWNHG